MMIDFTNAYQNLYKLYIYKRGYSKPRKSKLKRPNLTTKLGTYNQIIHHNHEEDDDDDGNTSFTADAADK